MNANPRVISLIASSTEIISALGFADCLVARSHECDFPPGVGALPTVTRAKLRTDVSSLEIDRQVKDILRAGLSVYAVDAETLRDLARFRGGERHLTPRDRHAVPRED